jgi:CRP-like cAMP-binding protein
MAAPENHDLGSIEILSSLSAEERRDFEKSCRWRRFASAEQIIDRQDSSRDIYFITEGVVRIVNYTVGGREVTLEDLGAGSYFGELAALDGAPRSASAVALEDSTVAKMAPERFLRVLKLYPDVALRVMVDLAQTVRASTQRIMDLSTLGANNRVHSELLRLAHGFQAGDNRAVISPIPVHSDMASRASTTRETVARVLSDLSRKRLVRREKDALVVLDVEKLEEMVEDVRG